MEIAPGRLFSVISFVTLFSAGCSPAYNGNLYVLDLPENCPASIDEALAPVNIDPLNASAAQMSCALQAIRNLQPPDRLPKPEESLEASKICLVLAESSISGRSGAKRRKELGWEGVEWAQYAMRTGIYSNPATSYYYSVNLGVAVRDSIMTAMRYMTRLHLNLERAVREAPETDYAGPLRTLGYFLIKAPAWPAGPGDSEKGLEMLEKAASLFPDYPPNQIYVARGYWESEEDDETAMEGVKAAIRLLKSRKWGLRHNAWVLDLKDLLVDMLGEQETAVMMSGLEPVVEPAVNESLN